MSAIWCVPFALLLACIAVLPLAWPHGWEKNKNKAIAVVALSVPVALYLLQHEPQHLLHSALEYGSFIALLAALFVVSGGVLVEGDLVATPKTNVAFLACGALLANLIGTTGASMLLIRPLLRTNRQREHTSHLAVFFILIVSNCGGLLTPLGDPPLFLGYLHGVPFTWTWRLWPIWLLANIYLAALFFAVDRRAYARETQSHRVRDVAERKPVAIRGKRNLWLMLVTAVTVLLPAPYRELCLVAVIVLSLKFTEKSVRSANGFTFAPLVEVAILFAGIFVTMIPALELLKAHAGELGLATPRQFFFGAGVLSSLLDNAPTYLSFLSAAQGLAQVGEPQVVGVWEPYLVAVSVGSVFMGANTYIGNGPNFMVKSIADDMGFKTPTFFGYALTATLTLTPVYLVVALFFLP